MRKINLNENHLRKTNFKVKIIEIEKILLSNHFIVCIKIRNLFIKI